MPPRRAKPDLAPVFQELESIYASLTTLPVVRSCTNRTTCCRFQLTGETPQLTLPEALYAAKAVRRNGRTRLPDTQDGSCPLLGQGGRCTIYDHRPFGCRTHFCTAAGGQIPRKQVAHLIQKLDALDERLGGDGSRPIQSAVADALKNFG